MRVWTLNELFRLTRTELFTLHARIVGELPMLSRSDRHIALANLRNICRALAHPHFTPQ